MDLILAVDVGTQSLKACILDRDLNILEEQKVSYFPNVRGKNRVEFDAEELWDAFLTACKGLRKSGDVEAISFSTLCPSLAGHGRRWRAPGADHSPFGQAELPAGRMGAGTGGRGAVSPHGGQPPLPRRHFGDQPSVDAGACRRRSTPVPTSSLDT